MKKYLIIFLVIFTALAFTDIDANTTKPVPKKSIFSKMLDRVFVSKKASPSDILVSTGNVVVPSDNAISENAEEESIELTEEDSYFGIGLGTEADQVLRKYGSPLKKEDMGINPLAKKFGGVDWPMYKLVYDKVSFQYEHGTRVVDDGNDVTSNSVNSIEINDPSYKTKKGIGICSTVEEIKSAYGKPYIDTDSWSYQGYEIRFSLVFYINNNKVSKISLCRMYDQAERFERPDAL